MTTDEGRYACCIIPSREQRDFGAIEAVGVLPSVSRTQAASGGDQAELTRIRAENIEVRKRLGEAP